MKYLVPLAVSIVLSIGACGATYYLMRFGNIWESHAHPTQHVIVYPGKSPVLKGQATFDWNGDWILLSDDGTRTVIDHSWIVAITPDADEQNNSVWFHWRSYFPASLFLALFVTVSLQFIFPRFRRVQFLSARS